MGREEPTNTNNGGREPLIVGQNVLVHANSNSRNRSRRGNVSDNDEKWQLTSQMNAYHHMRAAGSNANMTMTNQNNNNNNNIIIIDQKHPHPNESRIMELENELQNAKKTYMAIVADLKQQNLHLKNELKNSSKRNDITTNRFIAQTQERQAKICKLESECQALSMENGNLKKLLNESTDDFNNDLILDYKQLEMDYKEVECELDEVNDTLHEYEIKMDEAAKIVDQFERKCALMTPMVDEHPNLMKVIAKQSKTIKKLKNDKNKILQSKYIAIKSKRNKKNQNQNKTHIRSHSSPSSSSASLSVNSAVVGPSCNNNTNNIKKKTRRKKKSSNKCRKKSTKKLKSKLSDKKLWSIKEEVVNGNDLQVNANNGGSTPNYLTKKVRRSSVGDGCCRNKNALGSYYT